MARITVNDLKRGGIFEKDGAPYLVMDITMSTPSARGAAKVRPVSLSKR